MTMTAGLALLTKTTTLFKNVGAQFSNTKTLTRCYVLKVTPCRQNPRTRMTEPSTGWHDGIVAYTWKCSKPSQRTLCEISQIPNKCGKKHLGIPLIALADPLMMCVSVRYPSVWFAVWIAEKLMTFSHFIGPCSVSIPRILHTLLKRPLWITIQR